MPANAPDRAKPKRRSQAERRAETRKALLDATIECLVTYGYAQTTTGRIAELAGVSRGAQIPYFRTRDELVAAAVAHLADERARAVHERFTEQTVTLDEALDVLWEEHQGAMFDATLELWVASRTEPELRKKLHRIERDVATTVVREAANALGDVATRPDFAEDLLIVLATIRGLALLRISDGGSGSAVAKHWQHARVRLLRILAPA